MAHPYFRNPIPFIGVGVHALLVGIAVLIANESDRPLQVKGAIARHTAQCCSSQLSTNS
ncbi:MAG: hypothetical protein ACFE0I_22065 [Elainellaceae cyanobacterium]